MAEEKKLTYKKDSAFDRWDEKMLGAAREYAEGYKKAIDSAKTEREAVVWAKAYLSSAGYVPYKLGDKICAGGRYYLDNRKKSLYAFCVGKKDISEGVRIIASHIDSPRLDLKQHPLYEDGGVGYLKTHYYGGVRKYQWAALPLALHGVIIRADGTEVNVRIGDEPGDPVFCISDLLPHLAKEQNGKPLGTAFAGEGLNAVFGSEPMSEGDEKVKENLLRLLKRRADGRGDEVFAGHDFADFAAVIRFKAKVAVGQDADKFAVAGNRHAADAIARHQVFRVLNQVIGREEEGVGDNAVLRALHLINLRCLFCNGHVLVDDAQTAFARHCNGHAGIRYRVHCGRHQRNVQLNHRGELNRKIDFLGQHFTAGRNQQHIIERKTFPNNLLQHGRKSSS